VTDIEHFQVLMEIPQAGDYEVQLAFADNAGSAIDLSGHTFRAQVRSGLDGDTDALLADFTIDTTDADEGVILLTMPSATTADLTSDEPLDLRSVPIGWWDLWDDDGTDDKPIMGGPCHLLRTVTRA
jgi:hypothetical protein